MNQEIFDLQLFAEEKTEEATPHRRQEVRKKGQVARSPDLSAAAVLLVGCMWLYFQRESLINFLAQLMRWVSSQLATPMVTSQSLKSAVLAAGPTLLGLLGPLLLLSVGTGLVVTFAQVGFLLVPSLVEPRMQNINPLEGLKRMFSRRALFELAKSLIKVSVTAGITYWILSSKLTSLLMLGNMQALPGYELIAGIIFYLGLWIGAAFLVLALVDFLYQKWEFNRNIRMSKYELKEEFRQTEGDPLVRSRLREKQRQLARHRMMHNVPNATVVITNPTHLAVALKYAPKEMDAPLVIAKGAGSIAKRIVEVAIQHQVPIVENQPLARSLYYQTEIGQQIPVELYRAVAEVLAMIYRRQGLHRRWA
ncbi:MAG: flagellar biosynthesis protein FlhB [Clostridia bacterium]|nr:flagellar biosynthesis protein FlhB [Clostridia bacterium]